VGAALNRLLPGEDDVPWWRVVNRQGVLTIPPELGLRALQRTLLESEGVAFLAPDRIDLEAHGWAGPHGDPGDR
jgi:alkylated DNA nucleotide flippase Atl1